MLKIYKLDISGKTEKDAYEFLDLLMGNEGYTLYGVATSEGELDKLIGTYVVDREKFEYGRVKALVIEDNNDSVVDILFLTRYGFKWTGTAYDHYLSTCFIDAHFHGGHIDLSYTDWMKSNDSKF